MFLFNGPSANLSGAGGILVMIPYGTDVGFAIGRLAAVFHDVATRLCGDASRVHFAFARVDRQRGCASLPAEFTNYLEFNHRSPDGDGMTELVRYVHTRGISAILALDMPVESSCARVARRAGVTHIVSYWGAPMSSLQNAFTLALKRLEVRAIHRARPDLFVFESRAMREFAVRGRGISHHQTAVVPTGVDPEYFRPMTEYRGAAHERFEIPPDRAIIVYAGHLHERKGVRVLMRAMVELVQRMGRRDVHALFLGNRPGESKAFETDWQGAQDFVTFGGYQSDVPTVLADCYAGCIPSTGWDSFPMSSLEMQACGLPVIVSDLQGTPETIERDVTGLVTPAGDATALAQAIAALVDKPDRRAEMARAARVRIEGGFTRAHQVNELCAVLGGVRP